MDRCKGSSARTIVEKCITSIENIKAGIDKDYGEMDIENSKLSEDIEEVINSMKSYCDKLIIELEEYTFE